MSHVPEGPGRRIPRVLSQWLAYEEMTPERVAQIDYLDLARAENFGKLSMEPLRAWLQSHSLDLKNAPPRDDKIRCPHCGGSMSARRKKLGVNGL